MTFTELVQGVEEKIAAMDGRGKGDEGEVFLQIKGRSAAATLSM